MDIESSSKAQQDENTLSRVKVARTLTLIFSYIISHFSLLKYKKKMIFI